MREKENEKKIASAEVISDITADITATLRDTIKTRRVLTGLLTEMALRRAAESSPETFNIAKLSKEFSNFSKETQQILKRALVGEISDKELKTNMTYLNKAESSLENARKAIMNHNSTLALNELINAKGFLEKVNNKIFDTRFLRVQIERIRLKKLKPLLEEKL